eukprot:2706851-Pleurochrysis_carterae.AAC.1
MASTVSRSARSVHPAFCAMPSLAYMARLCVEAQRQMSCITSLGQPAARKAQASPIRNECQEMTLAVCASKQNVISRFNHASSLACVYGSPLRAAKSGVDWRRRPRQ